jgi:hypothetical protein
MQQGELYSLAPFPIRPLFPVRGGRHKDDEVKLNSQSLPKRNSVRIVAPWL